MTAIEPRIQTAVDAAIAQIALTARAAGERVWEKLGFMAQSGVKAAERDLLVSIQSDLRRGMGSFERAFNDNLREKISTELAPRRNAVRPLAETNWETLSLVEESEMEERMFSDRIGQMISHKCEAELRDLAAHMNSLLSTDRPTPESNPLRAETIGAALYSGIETVSNQPETRKVLTREIGQAMAESMPECYKKIIADLKARGVQPKTMTVRSVDGPGNRLPGVSSGYATLQSTRSSQHGDFSSTSAQGALDAGQSTRGGRTEHTTLGDEPGAARRRRANTTRPGGPQSAQADAQLMTLLRRLTSIASRPGELDALPRQSSGAEASPAMSRYSAAPDGDGAWDSAAAGLAGGSNGPSDGMTGMMAVNLIRAHREELVQASSGKLDHMVIDVVGSLFDQILSDSRVPPQMARQIARLQLPVLRVALSDSSFFSSRRHPVRRFVNRIASLACAFDDFTEGPGLRFLARVRELVQEIVEGDFDQVDVYSTKLASIEAFIAEQASGEVQQTGAVNTLNSKESELRLQQRYMIQLRNALAPMSLPAYLAEFLPQVWSQALVLAVSRDGADSDRAQRYRRVGRDLVLSVQPKGSPALRKQFLMQLPSLMRDLNEGLQLVGWPDAAQREFFGKLLPAHAESLKGQPLSELDHNMLVKQLEAVFNMALPAAETLSAADAVPEVPSETVTRRFSPEEAKRVGLVDEAAVDWSGDVDIDLTEDVQAQADGDTDAEVTAPSPLEVELDINLDITAEPPEPTHGAQLIDHIKLGFAYQMHLKDEWQKVRLAHVSAGRSFFVFTAGHKHQETISMTSRMLARMCETNRFRAVESAYLMERATQRARKQLAALTASTKQ